MKGKGTSIRWQLMIVCIVLVTIPIVALGVLTYMSSQQRTLQDIEERLGQQSLDWQTITQIYADQITTLLEREDELIRNQVAAISIDVKKMMELTVEQYGANPPDAVREQLLRGPEWVILGSFQPALIGVVGLIRDRHFKSSHKAHLWGMYVAPAYRGKGVGTDLLQAALRHARTLPGVSWVHLSVSSAAPAAQRLYERAGFKLWGTEPDALCHEGQTADEHHMALRL